MSVRVTHVVTLWRAMMHWDITGVCVLIDGEESTVTDVSGDIHLLGSTIQQRMKLYWQMLFLFIITLSI